MASESCQENDTLIRIRQPIKFIKLSAEDVLDKRVFQNTEEKEQQ